MFIESSKAPWEPVDPGVERQVLGCGAGLSLARVRFAPGAMGAMHVHEEFEQSSVVESGVFDITIGGQTKRLGAGDGFFVPKGVLHEALCVERGVLVDTFSPGRWGEAIGLF